MSVWNANSFGLTFVFTVNILIYLFKSSPGEMLFINIKLMHQIATKVRFSLLYKYNILKSMKLL